MIIRFLKNKINMIRKKNRFIDKGLNNSIRCHDTSKLKNITLKIEGNNNRVIFCKKSRVESCEIEIKSNNSIILFGQECHVKNSDIYFATKEEGILYFGKKCSIGGTQFYIGNGSYQKVSIGKRTTLYDSVINCSEENGLIRIGNDCMFSFGVVIMNSDTHPIYDLLTDERIGIGKSVVIGNKVWLGSNVQIGKNIEIADNVIVGRGAIVTKSIMENNVVAAGVPAKIIKKNVYWEREYKES